jgi:site-specific recombinase XerD
MSFTEYLKHKKYSDATINTYQKYLGYFTSWLTKENLDAAALTYTELLDYIRYLQEQGKSKTAIHGQLGVVRHYLNFLISERKRNDNPAAGLFIKGRARKLPSGLLNIEELELLYQQYSMQLHVDDYKKIMLGLLVFQGITVGELLRIKAADIKLAEGKILIKGTARSNERLLSLHVNQLLSLKQYLDKNKFAEMLFTTARQSMTQRIQYMFGQLRKLNKKVTNAKQIRSSVISHWLKQYHLRQVQYMAGHKYVSSTERYQLGHLDDLTNAVKEHHPMK